MNFLRTILWILRAAWCNLNSYTLFFQATYWVNLSQIFNVVLNSSARIVHISDQLMSIQKDSLFFFLFSSSSSSQKLLKLMILILLIASFRKCIKCLHLKTLLSVLLSLSLNIFCRWVMLLTKSIRPSFSDWLQKALSALRRFSILMQILQRYGSEGCRHIIGFLSCTTIWLLFLLKVNCIFRMLLCVVSNGSLQKHFNLRYFRKTSFSLQTVKMISAVILPFPRQQHYLYNMIFCQMLTQVNLLITDTKEENLSPFSQDLNSLHNFAMYLNLFILSILQYSTKHLKKKPLSMYSTFLRYIIFYLILDVKQPKFQLQKSLSTMSRTNFAALYQTNMQKSPWYCFALVILPLLKSRFWHMRQKQSSYRLSYYIRNSLKVMIYQLWSSLMFIKSRQKRSCGKGFCIQGYNDAISFFQLLKQNFQNQVQTNSGNFVYFSSLNIRNQLNLLLKMDRKICMNTLDTDPLPLILVFAIQLVMDSSMNEQKEGTQQVSWVRLISSYFRYSRYSSSSSKLVNSIFSDFLLFSLNYLYLESKQTLRIFLKKSISQWKQGLGSTSCLYTCPSLLLWFISFQVSDLLSSLSFFMEKRRQFWRVRCISLSQNCICALSLHCDNFYCKLLIC